MIIKGSTVAFTGTKEQETELRDFLKKNRDVPGVLMPSLQKAQEIYGYLPEEVQKMIAEELDIPLAEVFGTATFYSQFTLNPKGQNEIAVCLGTACYVKGSGEVLAKIEEELGIKAGECTSDGKFSISATRCIGCCGLAPVLTVNGDVYGKVVPEDVKGILEKYK